MMTQAQIQEQQTIANKLDAGIELTERENMLLIYSDYHKEAYGFRPRGFNVFALTTEELKADFARFGKICQENAEEEAKAEAKAVEAFKALIQKTIELGAGDEDTALRWLIEAAVDSYNMNDLEHYLWQQGILYTDYGKEIADKLSPIFDRVWQERQQIC